MHSTNANATTIAADGGVRQAALRLADALLDRAVESLEDVVAAALCAFCVPAALRRTLAHEEKRAFAVELVVVAVGRRYGLGAGMALIGADREQRGVFSFPVGARSCVSVEASPGGYKVLDAVLLRRRRGPVKTETLVWRVSRRGATGRETETDGTYPDREQALLDFYSG